MTKLRGWRGLAAGIAALALCAAAVAAGGTFDVLGELTTSAALPSEEESNFMPAAMHLSVADLFELDGHD